MRTCVSFQPTTPSGPLDILASGMAEPLSAVIHCPLANLTCCIFVPSWKNSCIVRVGFSDTATPRARGSCAGIGAVIFCTTICVSRQNAEVWRHRFTYAPDPCLPDRRRNLKNLRFIEPEDPYIGVHHCSSNRRSPVCFDFIADCLRSAPIGIWS